MAERDILEEFGINQEEIENEVKKAFSGLSEQDLEKELDESVTDYSVNTVLEGRVVDISDDEVMIDVGYKSEGIVPKVEWDEPSRIKVGDVVEVLLEAVEDDTGLVQLSKRKADRIRSWERIIEQHKEGDIVTARVMRKIKGGLLVDIGVPVFLPASQVDIRRPGEIADYIGYLLTCKILKIDQERFNIVVSRRQLIEAQREVMKKRMFEKLRVGEIRTGKVKNIVDFGAFVDLGGIDGLLHITDMSWGRISHPSEMVAIDDELEVKILNVDPEKGKVALGLKQKTPSPWEQIEEKYPPGSVVRGEVVNLVSYGAFVKLEEGVEGLVHVSEMSWTRRVNHPSEVVAIGDVVDVVVLGINRQKEEISLGMKQTEQNPWELVAKNYPPGTRIVGRVRNLTNYGAFVEIEEGIDGLLHVSDMSWTKKVNHPSEVVKKGDTIETVVLSVNAEGRRVAMGLKQLTPDPWKEEIPGRYQAGDMVRGVVSKLTSFGAFVKLEDELEGLLHISELSDKKISSPEEIVDVGDVVDLRVIKVDPEARKIGLSLRGTAGPDQQQPRIVIRSEELEEAEDQDKLVQEAMRDAPQLQPDRRQRKWEPKRPAEAESSLAIPTAAVEEVKEEEPQQQPAAEQPADEAAEEGGEPAAPEPESAPAIPTAAVEEVKKEEPQQQPTAEQPADEAAEEGEEPAPQEPESAPAIPTAAVEEMGEEEPQQHETAEQAADEAAEEGEEPAAPQTDDPQEQ